MRKNNYLTLVASFTLALVISLFGHTKAFSHCDGMDGSVVMAAQKALETGDVNLVLIWVQKKDEDEIRKAFQKTFALRKLSPEARDLADMYFFETLVRIHRAGEGESYTGIKPAGREYVEAYVIFIHYVETLYDTAKKGAHGHSPGHQKAEGHDH
jgi:hypothetical protein